jgi:hypothetical protein
MGFESHSDLNIMSRAIVEAFGSSCYFVADKGWYLNSKLAAFVLPANRGVAGGGIMGPSQAQNIQKINILSRKIRVS